MSVVTKDHCARGKLFYESNPQCVFNYHDQPIPNVDFICTICKEKIHSACLLSPDWSATMQWKSALVQLREHNLTVHGIRPPND